MVRYENTYFKIKVDFPSFWRVRTGSNAPLRSESKIQYQSTDDDLPKENDDFRTLLFASCHIDGSPRVISAGFSIVIHKHVNGFDLLADVKKKDGLLESKFELLQILGRKAQIVRTIEDAESYNLITKIVAWEELPGIWFSVYCSGDSLQNFQVAEEIFHSFVRV